MLRAMWICGVQGKCYKMGSFRGWDYQDGKFDTDGPLSYIPLVFCSILSLAFTWAELAHGGQRDGLKECLWEYHWWASG